MSSLFIGMISGTSADGIDAVLVDFSDNMTVIVQQTFEYHASLRQDILNLSQPSADINQQQIENLGHLDHQVGLAFANSANTLCKLANVSPEHVVAIGSHGQTVRHRPTGKSPFTLQIGDPNIIAYQTGITTIADFRRMDLAAGGQGAPLVPLFHQWLYSNPNANRAILNLGGIANLTWLPKDSTQVLGFDTGPANALSDYWVHKHLNQSFDERGNWAASGQINTELLTCLLDDNYFSSPLPKSTGREYFDHHWLESRLTNFVAIAPKDVQATLVELSAITVADQIKALPEQCDSLLLCGGGAHNQYLTARIENHLDKKIEFNLTHNQKIDGDFVEASAFAWLAKQRTDHRKLDFRTVTGAAKPLLYGNIYS